MSLVWTKELGYVDSGIQISDTHGANASLHLHEMEQICNSIVDRKLNKLIPEIENNAFNKALSVLLDALKIDINSVVQVGLRNAGDIFYGKECQTAIMNAIYNEIIKHIESNYKL